MIRIQRIVWYIANILSQLNHAWKVGWRDGAMFRPGAHPPQLKQQPPREARTFKREDYSG